MGSFNQATFGERAWNGFWMNRERPHFSSHAQYFTYAQFSSSGSSSRNLSSWKHCPRRQDQYCGSWRRASPVWPARPVGPLRLVLRTASWTALPIPRPSTRSKVNCSSSTGICSCPPLLMGKRFFMADSPPRL